MKLYPNNLNRKLDKEVQLMPSKTNFSSCLGIRPVSSGPMDNLRKTIHENELLNQIAYKVRCYLLNLLRARHVK